MQKSQMIISNTGQLSILDLIEEIPFEVRPQVIDSLSAFHDPELVPFYYLLKMEYGSELTAACDRALEKCRMAGMNISLPVFFKGDFIKSYASISRHTGRMTIDVAWHIGGSKVYVECFYLIFNPDGIHSFFIIENMPLIKYEQDRKILPEMIIFSPGSPGLEMVKIFVRSAGILRKLQSMFASGESQVSFVTSEFEIVLSEEV